MSILYSVVRFWFKQTQICIAWAVWLCHTGKVHLFFYLLLRLYKSYFSQFISSLHLYLHEGKKTFWVNSSLEWFGCTVIKFWNFFLKPCWNYWAWILSKISILYFGVNIYCQLMAAVFSTTVFYFIKSPETDRWEGVCCKLNAREASSLVYSDRKLDNNTDSLRTACEGDRLTVEMSRVQAHQKSWGVCYSYAWCPPCSSLRSGMFWGL